MFCNSVQSSVKTYFRCITTPPLHKLIRGNKSKQMTVLKGQAELDSYKLTKKEIADYLGISTNAVRMSMRGSNYHNLEYRKSSKGFLFKVPKRPGDNMGANTPLDHGAISTPKSTPRKSKVVNRGATHRGEANYTSLALKMSNEAKTVGAINNKFVDEAHKKAFMEMTEASMDQAYKNSRQQKEQDTKTMINKSYSQDNSGVLNPRSHGKYGSMLNAQGLKNVDDRHHSNLRKQKDTGDNINYVEKYQDVMQLDGSFKRQLVKTNTIDFSERSTNSSGSYFVGHANYDDFSNKYDVGRNEVGAEFSQYELDNYSKPEERTQFDSKVEESIYRAKKHLLKTKGDY